MSVHLHGVCMNTNPVWSCIIDEFTCNKCGISLEVSRVSFEETCNSGSHMFSREIGKFVLRRNGLTKIKIL